MDVPAPPAKPQRPATAGSWKPGQSGNPKGRPRSGLAFAEAVRERINPHDIIDLAERVMRDETMTPEHRLTALWPLIDRGFIKPPTTIAAQVETRSSSRDWSQVSLEEKRALLAQLRGEGYRAQNPTILDGERRALSQAVAIAVAVSDEESKP